MVIVDANLTRYDNKCILVSRGEGCVIERKIHVITLGGGILLAKRTTNPTIIDIDDMLRLLEGQLDHSKIQVTTFHRTPSSALLVDDVISLAVDIAKTIDRENPQGFVVVQGTDTIEETAFALNTLIDCKAPIVVTGSVRTPDMPSSDGLANLLAALRVAASESCRGLGCVVVFNETIYPADFVRNTHTHLTNTFSSECGPLGFIVEGTPSIRVKPIRRKVSNLMLKTTIVEPVPICSVPLGDDGRLLGAVREIGYRGLVIEAMGGGHVPESLAHQLEGLASDIPIVLASRVGAGDMLNSTYYGYPGSETALLNLGLISSGFLDARKARILLILQLMSGFERAQIMDGFRVFSRHHTND